jgi:hypothetical protein
MQASPMALEYPRNRAIDDGDSHGARAFDFVGT